MYTGRILTHEGQKCMFYKTECQLALDDFMPSPPKEPSKPVVLKGRDSRSKDRALKVGKLGLEARPPELAVDGFILVPRLVEEASAEKAWFGQGHEDFQYTGQEILREATQVEVLGRVGHRFSAFCLSSLDPAS
ncbi:hypothetical protein FHG87_014852 [Trinorchestia longiramus]|nr:hypothetical protein FHG87_014852 [Trinorchestia longiramus]